MTYSWTTDGPDRIVKYKGELYPQQLKTFSKHPLCSRQFRYYSAIMSMKNTISSSFEELSKTLELVSDPVARHILSARIAIDLAGRGIEVNLS